MELRLTSTLSVSAGSQRPFEFLSGAATRNRTPDLLITSELLYLLSYGGNDSGEILGLSATFAKTPPVPIGQFGSF